MKYYVRILIGISMIILGLTLRSFYGEDTGSILPMVIGSGMVLAGFYIGRTLVSIVSNYRREQRRQRCFARVHTVKDGGFIQKRERSLGENTLVNLQPRRKPQPWHITPEREDVNDLSKSVEKRLAIQKESEYDRGFRHGLANNEANNAANCAANERLRRDLREARDNIRRLQDTIRALHTLSNV